MMRFTGIWVALVTPFRHQEIDFPALQSLARRMADAGVAGLVVCGSTGEAAALSDGEQLAVLDAVIEAVPHCPIVMGLSGTHMPAVLALLRQIEARRIAGLLVPAPAYIRPSQEGLIAYFTQLANASGAPIILYNIPYRTGVHMSLDTIRTLTQHERIAAIKDCGGDAHLTMQLIRDGKLDVLSGEDHQIFSTLCLGGSGAITASAHIRPELFVHLTRLLELGQLHEARELFLQLLPMIRVLFDEPNPAGVKAVLSGLGLIANELRFPMQTASSALQDKLLAVLETLPADARSELTLQKVA
ncbi:MAG: 4-hydroxy-tetrahydrodipicolinate synthase [Burkholderiales bacterium]|nr:4-hydroxy-tetrahydrodipicolinate synthase [Burkholderiales bacterium]